MPQHALSPPGCTLRVSFLDQHEQQQQALIHTTESREALLEGAQQVKAALEGYYQSVGGHLLAVQVLYEEACVVREAPPPPRPRGGHLRLAAVHGVRLGEEYGWTP